MNAERHLTPRNVATFRELQTAAAQRLGFSVTKACPLRCAHCSASASPIRKAESLSQELAEQVVAELPELKRIGITWIDFTGGEPTLATRFVRTIAAAARALDMTTSVVTAAHWAKDAKRMTQVLDALDDISHWDISTDLHHLPFVPLQSVRSAYAALAARDKPPVIRVAYNEEMTREEARLIHECHEFAGERMAFQHERHEEERAGNYGRCTAGGRRARARR